MKVCSKCKEEKEQTEFYKRKTSKDGLRTECKECVKFYQEENKDRIEEYRKNYQINNREIIKEKKKIYREKNIEDILINNKIFYDENKKKLLQQKKDYYESNKEIIKEKVMNRYNSQKNDEDFLEKKRINGRINCKKHRDNNKEKISQRIKERKLKDPLFKLTDSIRTLLWVSINKMGFSKNGRTQEILGCSFEEFKIYIENLFQEGMSWENHGDWHLDHRTPVSWAKSESEVYDLNKYENFKPMWAFENMSKGNKYTD